MTVVVALVLLVAVSSASAVDVLCSQKAEVGFCRAAFPRFFFNAESGKCESFIYGGCGGNSNNFATLGECHSTCAAGKYAASKEVLCSLEAVTGMCKAYIPSFFFNSATGKCESFVYGGCGGNANRFSSPSECQATCGAPKEIKKRDVNAKVVCSQEAKTGMCLAYIPSFFYNVNTGECESFIYGGCGGNENRFSTKDECHATCAGAFEHQEVSKEVLCAQKAETGMCRAYIPSFFFNAESGKCESFIYGGCGGNDNRFASEGECHATCGVAAAPTKNIDAEVLCSQEAETGLCMAYFPSFFYNVKTGQCESFIYGGCGGNENRFRTKDECHATCAGVTQHKEVSKEVLCAEKAETGMCRAYIPSFFFNSESGQCESFIYGGCGGNENRFNSIDECHATCASVSAPQKRALTNEVLCAQKAETGFCRGYFPSFYFNTESGQCESFVYGGCGGNDNRFESKDECHATCGQAQEETPDFKLQNCFQEVKVGPCLNNVNRVYFNRMKGSCETFVYGGCQGNENNFESIKDCENHCLVV